MGLGLPHLLLILVILLVFFGPSRLPGLGKSLGEAIKGFKNGLNDDALDVTDSAKKKESLHSAQQTQKTTETETEKKNS